MWGYGFVEDGWSVVMVGYGFVGLWSWVCGFMEVVSVGLWVFFRQKERERERERIAFR